MMTVRTLDSPFRRHSCLPMECLTPSHISKPSAYLSFSHQPEAATEIIYRVAAALTRNLRVLVLNGVKLP